MLGVDYPYREHSEAAGIAIAVAQKIADHCEKAASPSLPVRERYIGPIRP